MNKKDPRVAVLILTYNPFDGHTKFIKKMLKSFRKVNYNNYSLWVVDNGSPREYISEVTTEFKDVKFILNKKNYGFSIGNNIGMKKIIKEDNPDYLLLLNDDMEINDKNFLKKMVSVGQKDIRNGIMGCMDVFEDGSL